MANEIKLKRGSGSDPGASDLVVGEIAIRTDTGKLFTKKDDNSIAEISGGGISDGDKGDITVSNSGATFTIDSGVVTSAKIADGAIVNADINASAAISFSKMNDLTANTIVGRRVSNGSPQELTAAQVRTILNVEDGATADQSKSDIDALGIAASTAATLATARNIGGVSFDGSANINLPGVNTSGNQDTTGNADTATTSTRVTVTDQSSDTSCFVLFTQAATGDVTPHSGSNLTFNSSSGVLTATGFAGALTGNVTGNASGSSGSCTGNAATATALANARTIAGVSFDGTSNISLNNNAITNGAGYITATLTNEEVQDIVGGMVSGNTESGITVTYQDGDGTLDFSVASQTDENFTTTLKNKLDGIAASATNVTNNNQLTNGAGYITATLTNEQVQDIVGAMVSSNTETGITVTYQDGDGTLDFVVASQTDENFTTTLKNKLDGIATGATNVTNNNQLTNGAGYITSATDSTKMPLSGGEFTGNITTHDVIPDGNNSRNLGSSSARYANLFINDMHFANSPENPNKVDGTWGDWTLQEGENQIYMLNNRNGKKYAMNLTEIV